MYELECSDVKTVLGKNIKMFHRLQTTDMDTIRAVMIFNEYKANTFPYEDNDVFIDLGAHIGTWTILMATLNPTFTIYSYEPLPENYAMLKRNIEINNLHNVHPFMLAVSSKTDKENVYYTDDSTPFGASHKFVGSMLGGGPELECPSISLNDVFCINNIMKCKVLKADCEGCAALGFSNLTPENFRKIDWVVGEFHSIRGITMDDFRGFFEPYFIDESKKIVKEGEIEHFLYKRKGREFRDQLFGQYIKDFDFYRSHYKDFTFEDSKQINKEWHRHFPHQQFYDLEFILDCLQYIHGKLGRFYVIELGGHRGELALDVMQKIDCIWFNAEIIKYDKIPELKERPYYLYKLQTQIWNDKNLVKPECDVFVASHIIEHFSNEQLDKLLDYLLESGIKYLLFESPISEYGRQNWDGVYAAHILNYGQKYIRKVLGRKYRLVKENKRWCSFWELK